MEMDEPFRLQKQCRRKDSRAERQGVFLALLEMLPQQEYRSPKTQCEAKENAPSAHQERHVCLEEEQQAEGRVFPEVDAPFDDQEYRNNPHPHDRREAV